MYKVNVQSINTLASSMGKQRNKDRTKKYCTEIKHPHLWKGRIYAVSISAWKSHAMGWVLWVKKQKQETLKVKLYSARCWLVGMRFLDQPKIWWQPKKIAIFCCKLTGLIKDYFSVRTSEQQVCELMPCWVRLTWQLANRKSVRIRGESREKQQFARTVILQKQKKLFKEWK